MAQGSAPEDRYARIRPLGEGGAGRVWLVRDRRTAAELALKELTSAGREREAALRREFATLRTLRHPNLVEVHDFDTDPGSGLPRFTLEYVDGSDLVSTVRAEGPAVLPGLAAEALRALAFLHDFDILHRDLKPGNLLVRRRPRHDCRLVVLDFGLAVARGDAARGAAVAGTLPYLAPELLEGATPSRRSDLYGLGAVLHEAVRGAPPIPPELRDLDAIRAAVARCVAQLADPAGGGGVAAWLAELLAPEPDRRPAGAAEALARLNAACGTSFASETRLTRAARLASAAPPGREPELERLWTALEPAAGPRLVLLTGEAGSGKTRILRWLSADAVGQGWQVIDARAPDAGQLAAWRERAGERTTLVLIDELERAGPSTVQLLDRLAREPDTPPVRAIAALRPSEAHDPVLRKLLEDVGTVPTLARVDLGRLGHEAITRIVERATGSRAAARSHVAWLEQASEGNPLLLASLVVDAAWEPGAGPRGHPTLEAAIAGRVATLSEPGRRWLESLVVVGADAAAPTLAELAELDRADAHRAAEESELAGLATPSDGGAWSPASRLVVAVVGGALPPETQRRLHRRAAELLEETAGPGRLARLWRGAGEPERSIAAALAAREREARAGRPAEAADWCRFALVQLGRRDPRRRSLRLDHAELLLESRQHVKALRALCTALRLSGDPAQRAEILAKQAFARVMALDYDGGLETARRAAELAESLGLAEVAARAARAEGMALFRLERSEEAQPILLGAAEELSRLGDERAAAACVYVAGLCASRLRRFDEARTQLRRALDAARRCGDVELAGNALISLATAELRAYRLAEALRCHERAREWIDAHDLTAHRMAQRTNQSHALMEYGRYDAAIAALDEAEILALHLGSQYWWASVKLVKGTVLLETGRPARAVEELEAALRSSSRIEPHLLAYLKLSVADAVAHGSRPDEARVAALVDSVLESSTDAKIRLGAWLILLERAARLREAQELDRLDREFRDLARRQPAALEPPLAIRAALARGRGRLAAGDDGRALDDAAAALELATQKDLPALAAQALALRAAAERSLGRTSAADDALAGAREQLDRAAARIEDDELRRDFLAQPVFHPIRQSPRAGTTLGHRRLVALYDMIRALNSESDPELLLESMLDMVLGVVGAERGLILLREEPGGEYAVRLARNLEHETIADAEEFSRNVVLAAGAGKPVLAVDTAEDPRLKDLKSVSLFGIRSVLCVPLRARGTPIGAVYLDDRRGGTSFAPADLRFLEAFADHAALALENAQVRRKLELANRRLQVAAESRTRFGELIGRAPAMQRVYDMIEKAADSPLPVLILGESGTGKELVARAIHNHGPRRRAAFLTENCAAIPEPLLESELFGHVRGAFTGADRDRAGLFEQADGGTLFLDEVGDMPPAMQARLLRVIEEGELRRVGDERRLRVDVRVLAATHRDLRAEVAAGRFREDLLYRLHVLVIQLPPLRERPGDVALLVEHFLGRIAAGRDRPAPELRADVLARLERYSWPGNVRQLEHHLQRLVLLAGDGPITLEVVASDPGLRQSLLGEGTPARPVYSLTQNEQEQIRRALDATRGNRTRAAKLLGISRATIFRKIKEYGL